MSASGQLVHIEALPAPRGPMPQMGAEEKLRKACRDIACYDGAGGGDDFALRLRPRAKQAEGRVEGTSRHPAAVLRDGYRHGFLNAAMTAFAHHYPLSLSPDHIWLLVLQAVSAHVNGTEEDAVMCRLFAEPTSYRKGRDEYWERRAQEAEAGAADLRSRFVAHEGRKGLIVRRDDFVRGSPDNDWAGVVRDFAGQIDASLVSPGVAARLSANFSTTGLNEEIAAKVTVMETCKNYFSYQMHTMCGIPSVTLEGTAEDWARLREKAEEVVRAQCLDEFAEWWLPSLLPVLDRLAASARGDVDATFWRSFVKRGSSDGSGGYTFISGWINCFFPLTEQKSSFSSSGVSKNRWCQPYEESAQWAKYTRAEFDGKKPCFGDHMMAAVWGVEEATLPLGLSQAPVLWTYLPPGALVPLELKLKLVAGFFGAAQHPGTLALRPEIGWGVVDLSGPQLGATDAGGGARGGVGAAPRHGGGDAPPPALSQKRKREGDEDGAAAAGEAPPTTGAAPCDVAHAHDGGGGEENEC